MDSNVKAKWIEALESGKYKQGYGALKQEKDGELCYCCLGVLGEISGLKFQRGLNGIYNHKYYTQNQFGSLSSGYLPEDIISYKDQRYLSKLNDSNGLSFKEIAAEIRKMESL